MEEPGNDQDREWRRLAERLPREIAPERDLWKPIAERIRFEEAIPWTATRRQPARPLLAAAVVALVLAGSVLIARRTGQRAAPAELAERAGRASAEVAAVPTEAEWTAASDDVFRALEQEHPNLDPATKELVRQNLEIIDEAVRKIHRALEDDPSNPHLQRLLTAEYQRRSALLRKAASGAI
jgi:hypothetical protein